MHRRAGPVSAVVGGGGGGVFQDDPPPTFEGQQATKEVDEDPPPGVILRLSEVSGCEPDACCAALVACAGDFHGALATLREGTSADAGGAKARTQMRAAMQMFEGGPFRLGGVARGALGGAWFAAALLLDAFERIVPQRFLEIFAPLLPLMGVADDSPIGLLALLLPPLCALLVVIVLLRDLDGLLMSG